MRIITCASYYGTGSSAVTDLISESKNVFSLGEYEYRFLQDPNGISDLEYNIIENNHRHNSSNAIKEFIKYIKTLHGFGYANTYSIFGDELNNATEEYLNNIIQLKTKTWWHKDRIDKGRLFCVVDRLYSLILRVIKGQIKAEAKYSMLQNKEDGYYTAISEEDFLIATQKYIDRLFSYVNKENQPMVMVDQMVPPTNTKRYIRYFNDVKVIVVDRDPRDVFLLEKKIWKWGVIPYNDVKDFCKWYKITRCYANDESEDTSKILRIQFEDLIYKYEETRSEILNFVGLDKDDTIAKGTIFKPEISKRNTNLKKLYVEEKSNIEYIENVLNDYLYDFNR